MAAKKKSTKETSKSTPKDKSTSEKKKETPKLVILNRTNQKQVVEHKGKITTFLAGEKKTYTKNVESVLESFKYYLNNNILKQIN